MDMKEIYKMKILFHVLLLCALPFVAQAKDTRPKTVPAWQNSVDAKLAKVASQAYISNEIRCEWAGEDPQVAKLMPANLSFQFAVIGDSDVTNRVQKLLNDVADAMEPSVRQQLEKEGRLNSTLQWMVRTVRPAITNVDAYLDIKSHPAVFAEADFDAKRLLAVAPKLKARNIPPPVTIKVHFPDECGFLGEAGPCDYSDVMGEETFSLPYGAAYVIRAPERHRVVRIEASTQPGQMRPVRYIWLRSRGTPIKPWLSDPSKTLEKGYAEHVMDVSLMAQRYDIMVFAQYGKSLFSPPTIVSFCRIPYERRLYDKGRIKSILYDTRSPHALYDLSPIWVHRDWRDDFEYGGGGKIEGFSRTRKGVFRADEFSATGEIVISTHSSGLPHVVRQVEYFVSPETGLLDYRPVGEEIVYRIGKYKYRHSGE